MKKKLKYLVIHCTATPEDREVEGAEIKVWHTAPQPQGRGWKQVGYTDLFHLDGRIERLAENNEDAWVDDWEMTNGAVSYNSVSRHIVYVGGCSRDKRLLPKDTRTPAQFIALTQYVQDFHARYPEVKIVGHRDLPGVTKACPAFDVATWLKSIGICQ